MCEPYTYFYEHFTIKTYSRKHITSNLHSLVSESEQLVLLYIELVVLQALR